jgi:hypothetical protein
MNSLSKERCSPPIRTGNHNIEKDEEHIWGKTGPFQRGNIKTISAQDEEHIQGRGKTCLRGHENYTKRNT